MKIIEKNRRNYSDTGETFRFSIIGDKKKGSLKIPMWQGEVTISDTEILRVNVDVVKLIKRENAMKVFDIFYEDIFNSQ